MPTHSAPSEAVASTAGQTTRRWPVMACLAIAFAANGFVIASVQTGFPALFADAGYSVAAAAGFAALIGPSQVVARVIEILFGQTRSPIAVGVAADAALAFGVASLLALALTPAAGVFFALFFGAGQGVAYVIRGAIPLALFGPAGYGALTGRLSSVRIVFSALAPVAIAWTTENLGNDVAIILLIATALLSVSALALLRRVAA